MTKTPEQPGLLKDKVALVTGAARGIGRAIAADLSTCGAHVIACDILLNELNETAADLGERVRARPLDVTKENEWQQVVADTVDEFGSIDILVNNAGILMFATLEDTEPEQFRQLMDVNVHGCFLGMHTVIPVMKKAGSGAIVNFSSTAGLLPNNATGAYAASKFALRGLTRSAALELGHHGIRVNSIHPGGVNTPMTNPENLSQEEVDQRYLFVPQQRGCDPAEIAACVRFLVSDHASYCNGTELVVDGGMTAGLYFPGFPGAPAALNPEP